MNARLLRQFATLCAVALLPPHAVNAQMRSAAKSTLTVQPPDKTSTTTTTAQPTKQLPAKKSSKTNGKGAGTIRLPSDQEFERFLKFLNRAGPDYAVNSIELKGTAEGDRAVLSATILVKVMRKDEWLRVPVFLNEAVLRKTDYQFLGQRIGVKPDDDEKGQGAFADSTQEAGYRWWFRGKGFHQLKLAIVVPVVKTVAQRRIRLSLPPMAAASTLTLKVPVDGLEKTHLTVPRNTDHRVRKAGEGSSEIDLVGIGAQLDLQWRSVIARASSKPILHAESATVVNVAEESVVLTVVQRIRAFAGKFGEVQVTLPPGFQFLNVTGDFVESFSKPDARNRCTVRFRGTRSEMTEIKWTLEKRLKNRAGRFSLEELSVAGARVQSGDFGVLRVPGLRIAQSDDGNRGVLPIRSSEFAIPDLIRDRTLAGAYRFLRQPYRLNLEIAPLQPHVTVEPNYSLEFSKDKVTLSARFLVNISEDGGLIDRFDIVWPNWREDGWKLQPLAASRIIERRTYRGKAGQAVLSHRLFRRRNGGFPVQLTATRPLAGAGKITLILPKLQADVSQTASLRVSRSVNTEVLISRKGEALRPENAKQAADDDVTYRLPASADAISAEVTTHPRKVEVERTVSVSLMSKGATVRQVFDYDVRYEPLSSIALRVPRQLADAVEFLGENKQPIEGRISTRAGADEEYQVIEFPDLPKIGQHRIFAIYTMRYPAALERGDSQPVTIPLVTFDGADRSQTQVFSTGSTSLSLVVNDKQWRARLRDGRLSWRTSRPAKNVSTVVSYPEIPQLRQFAVSRSLIRAVIEADGTVRYRAQYRLAQGRGEFVVNLPASMRLDAIWVGRRKIENADVGQQQEDESVIRIPILKRNALLTIDFRKPADGGPGWLGGAELTPPRLPASVSVGESVWKVSLPPGRYLSSYGRGVYPEFRWQLTGARFTRQPTSGFQHPGDWIGAGDGPAWNEPTEVNMYVFRQFGSSGELSIGLMSGSAIVLFGAGLAWLIGLMLAKYSAARNVFTFLSLALLASVAGLWYAQEFAVLAQPAIVGAAIAAICIAGERYWKRDARPATVTAANPTEFLVNSRAEISNSGQASIVIGSRDATDHRAPEVASVQASSEMRRQG